MTGDKIEMSPEELRSVVSQAVKDTLTTLGIDTADPLAMQKDFQHLRDWRESTDNIKKKGLITLVGILVAGALGAMVLGAKAYFKV